MSGATFSRIKNWNPEILTNTDLNAEIDNILNHLDPTGVGDYSDTAAMMRLQTDPGGVNSESLATSLAGELERLRYVVKRLIGSSINYWYESPPSTITDIVASIGSANYGNRIASGRTTGNSSQMCALVPSGVSASLTLTASTTPFIYYISGVQYSITANVTLTGLGLASGTNNTCSVNVTAAAAQQWSRFIGQYGTVIDVDGMQSGISALTSQFAGFKSSGNEYFMAYVNSSLTLTNAWRGCFFNQTPTSVIPAGLSNNDEIKLMRLTWVFANTSGGLAVTYTNPAISATAPATPATGDYWLDLSATAWKTYNSVAWITASATLIGMSMQDTVACVAARTFDSFKTHDSLNSMQLVRTSNTVVSAKEQFSEACVFGTAQKFGITIPRWDVTTDLESGQAESINTVYYMYMKETGAPVMSNIAPSQRRDLRGLYHPSETWRCLGNVLNDPSTNFVTPVRSFRDVPQSIMYMGNYTAYDTTAQGTIPDLLTDSERFIEKFANPAASFTTTVTAGTYGDIATATLTAGTWKVSGYLQTSSSGTIAATSIRLGFNTLAGNNSPVREAFGFLEITNGCLVNLQAPTYFFTVQTPTQVYLKTYIASGSPNVFIDSYLMLAERVDALNGIPQ